MLSNLAKHCESRVTYITKDGKLKSDKKAKLENRREPDSENILLHGSSLDNAPETSLEKLPFKILLDKTGGVPIGLNVIGSRAKCFLEDNMDRGKL